MKPTFPLLKLLTLAGSSLLAISSANAQSTLTWDAGGGGGAITNGGGAWLGANLWNNGGSAATWTSGDNAIFAGPATAGGAVTLASPTTVGSLTFSPSFTGTYTLGTAGQALTINSGIIKNASSGAATINSPIILGGTQSWTNNSTTTLTINAATDLNGSALTIDGSGFTKINGAAANIISGAGGITVNGARFELGGGGTSPAHTYSGDTTLTGGATVMFNGNFSANSNVNLNGGVIETYWTGGLNRTIGTGGNQIRITGGESGFAMNGNNGATFTLGALTWGDTNFKPTKLLLQNANSQGNSALTLASAINLNGGDRTVVAHQGQSGTAYSTISGAITNSTGTAGFIKEGAGLLILSNTGNSYNGATTISAGTLRAAGTGSIGDSSATNTLIFNGGTLQAGGTITSAATRSVTMNSTGIIDTNNQSVSIAGVISGAGGLTKIGTGTLTLSGANDYSGPTTLTAGTLSIGAANNLGAASSNLIFDGGTLQITGTSLNNFSSLGRTVDINAGATLGLDINNAGNTFTFDMSLPQNGIALAGAGTVAFQNTVSSLTLNPQSGTFTYGGVIADGAAGMDLIKTGAGTQTLQGANTYTGDTVLNAGTLNLSGAAGALTGTTGITFNGGGLTLTNTTNAEGAVNRIGDSVGITSNGGTLTYTNTSGASVYAETIGSVALSSGQMNFNLATNQTGAGSQTLTLSGLTQSGSGTVTFSAATTGPNATKNRIQVSGATETPAGEIIGAWATTGTAANNQSDYAVYDASGYVVARNTAGSAQSTWSTDNTTGTGTLNNTLANAAGSVSDGVLSASREINTLRNATTAASATANATTEYFTMAGNTFADNDIITVSGTGGTAAGELYYVKNVGGAGAGTFQISTTPGGAAVNLSNTTAGQIASGGLNLNGNSLGTYGVLNGAATRLNIAPGTGGVLTTPTGGGNLYLTTHGISTNTSGGHHGISVTAPINDNGLDAVTLVKSGVGVLQLNATSNYSGGTVLNSGTLWAQSDASLGDVNGDITFNGSATLLLSPNNGTSALTHTMPSTRSIIVNEGAMATIAGGRANATITINGDISGSGGVTTGRDALLSNGGVGTIYHHLLLGNNTFTGAFNVGNGLEGAAGGGVLGVTINSLADSTSPITLNFGSNGAFFSLGSTASADLSVTSRLVDLRNSNMTIRNQDANNTMTLGAVSTTTTGTKELKLGDGGAGGFIAGAITNGAGSLSLTKSGTGTWTLSGTSTYTGATTISGGTLRAGAAAGGQAFGNGSAVTLANVSGATLSLNGFSQTIGSLAGGGTTGGNVSLGADATLTTGGNNSSTTYAGVISGTGTSGLTKIGTGTLTLTNTNTYTGTTTINDGTLAVNGTGSINSSAVTINGGELNYNSSTDYSGTLTFTSGTLSGTNMNGSLSGQIIGLGQTIAPGNSPGTASTGAQTWATGGDYEWEINSTASGAGADPGWDLVSGTGALTITATAGNEFNINITSLTLGNLSGDVSDFNDASSYNWLIADFASITGFDAGAFILDTSAFTNSFTGSFGITLGTGVLGGDNTQIYLTYTAIPEPTAALLGSLGSLLLLRRRRAA